MKLKITTTIAVALGLANLLTAQANWELIDNFDDGNLDGWEMTRSSYNIIGYLPTEEEGDEAYCLLMDPTGSEGNPAMHIESGGYGYPGQFGSTWAIHDLPTLYPDQTTSTYYFQYFQEGGSNQFHMGLTCVEKVPVETVEEPVRILYESPNGWGDYAALFRMNEESIIELNVGGSSYRMTDFVVDSYTWYEFWMVFHNREGDWNDEIGDTYELWIRGGEWAEPTQVPVPPANPFDNEGNPNPNLDWAPWRKGSTEPLRYVYYGSQTGAPDSPSDGDPHLVDDLYYTEGKVLETPPGATDRGSSALWNGYPVMSFNGTDYVDTGSFLGLIALDPTSHYVYSFDVGGWVYADPELLTPGAGGWVFVEK